MTNLRPPSGLPRERGFTLLEILVVVGIVALLAQVALASYASYVARARAADLALAFDQMRTRMGVATKAGAMTDSCASLAQQVQAANVRSDYAAIDIAFEQTADGYTPMMRFCATRAQQGGSGVDVTREAHHVLSRATTMGRGAVVGDAAVSFAVPLADGASVCKTAPAAPTQACAGARPAATTVAAPAAAKPAQPAASAASSCTPSQTQVTRQVPRDVMTFGPARTGFAMNNGNLNTGGDLRAFTFEIAVVGGAQVPNQGIHGATIFSYASQANANEFLIWDPSNVKLTFTGLPDAVTGLNINDGANHRLTMSWDSVSGRMTLYDNGRQAWQGTLNQGGVLRGNGKMVLAQDQDSFGGGFDPADAFQGQIVTAALASAASSAAQVASGPIQTYFNKDNALITQAVMDASGQVVDATGRHTWTSGGALSKATQMVDTRLFVTSSCN
ncbi:MAG: prepilin-type N-terminal cleavage/methylation domain-containing protein [Ramlibacter sp.]